jgi:hypothetical protein
MTYSVNGVRIYAAFKDYRSGKYACFMMSKAPAVPFFECYGVIDDYGNLVPV